MRSARALGGVSAYTIDQSCSIHDPVASIHEQLTVNVGAPDTDLLRTLRTLSIQLVRGRNLGMAGGRLRTVQVERDADGTLGIGLDTDDRLIEVTNPRQLSLQNRDQIIATNGVPLADGNIIGAMRQVPRELLAFPVQLLRWPKGTEQPLWDVFAVMEIVATSKKFDEHSKSGENRLKRIKTESTDSRRPFWSVSTLVTLAPEHNTHELRLTLVREGAPVFTPPWHQDVGAVRISLDALGTDDLPFVRWLPLIGRDGTSIVGEFLLRITRCDWATRIGTSPDTGFLARRHIGGSIDILGDIFGGREPQHHAIPLARVLDEAPAPVSLIALSTVQGFAGNKKP